MGRPRTLLFSKCSVMVELVGFNPGLMRFYIMGFFIGLKVSSYLDLLKF